MIGGRESARCWRARSSRWSATLQALLPGDVRSEWRPAIAVPRRPSRHAAGVLPTSTTPSGPRRRPAALAGRTRRIRRRQRALRRRALGRPDRPQNGPSSRGRRRIPAELHRLATRRAALQPKGMGGIPDRRRPETVLPAAARPLRARCALANVSAPARRPLHRLRAGVLRHGRAGSGQRGLRRRAGRVGSSQGAVRCLGRVGSGQMVR